MIDILPHLITLSVVASLSPTMLAVMLLVLSMKNYTIARGSALFVGAAAAILMLLTIGLSLATLPALVAAGSLAQTWAGVDIALGLALVAVGVVGLVVRPQVKPPKMLTQHTSDHEPRPRLLLFSLGGFASQVTNLKIVLLTIASAKAIALTGLGLTGQLLAVVLVVVLSLLELDVPLGISVVAPERAARWFDRSNKWLTRHGYLIASLATLGVGLYLIYKGWTAWSA